MVDAPARVSTRDPGSRESSLVWNADPPLSSREYRLLKTARMQREMIGPRIGASADKVSA